MQYRPEIDGLRALAVLPVILFHAGITGFGGGFVGVDVFFVISGYLITSIIIKEMDQGTFSLVNFYERRARRILPVLFFIMVLFLPVAYFILLPNFFLDYAQSMVAVTFFASNIFFWQESGYFNTAAELQPLLHTWSLAVEEQFYILFPLGLMLLWRFGKKIVITLLIVAFFVSLGVAEWGAHNKPSASFFLLPTRAWELLCGSFTAFYLLRARPAAPMTLQQILSLLGVVMIAVAIFWYNKETPWPGVAALLPTIGTVLIILFATPGTIANTLLSLKYVVGIGLISYSAYLWHVPLFSLTRNAYLTEPPLIIMAGLSALTIVLSYLSWRYIEQPFRNKTKFNRAAIFKMSAMAMSFALLLGGFIITQKGFEDHYVQNRASPQLLHYLDFIDYRETSAYLELNRDGPCFLSTQTDSPEDFDKQLCLGQNPSKPNILLLGDSHATHLYHALSQSFNIHLLQASASGCRPLIPLEGSHECTSVLRHVFEEYLKQNKVDGVILAGRWREKDLVRLPETLEFLKNHTDSILIFGPVPEYYRELPLILAHLDKDGESPGRVEKASGYIKQDRFDVNQSLRERLQDQNDPAVYYQSITDIFCDKMQCTAAIGENIPTAWDYGHLTLEAAQYLTDNSPDLQRFIQAIKD